MKIIFNTFLFFCLFGCSYQSQMSEMKENNEILQKENKKLQELLKSEQEYLEYTCAVFGELQTDSAIVYLGNFEVLNQVTGEVADFEDLVPECKKYVDDYRSFVQKRRYTIYSE